MLEGAFAISLVSLVFNVIIVFKTVKIERLVATLHVVAGHGQNVSGEKNLTAQGDISVRS
jgi:hypothetical protein